MYCLNTVLLLVVQAFCIFVPDPQDLIKGWYCSNKKDINATTFPEHKSLSLTLLFFFKEIKKNKWLQIYTFLLSLSHQNLQIS